MPKNNPETGLIVCECDRCTGEEKPMRMVLFCPECGVKHIDTGEWATKPHKTHLCLTCGFEWRPSLINTVGVESIFPKEPDNAVDDAGDAPGSKLP